MSVFFVLTIQSPMLGVKVYNNNSQILHRAAGELDTEQLQQSKCDSLVFIDCC